MRIAVAHAGVAGGGVLDLRPDDAVGMRDLRGAVRTLAGDFHSVAARRTGSCVELDVVRIEVGVRPRVNARTDGRKVHGFVVAGIAVLPVEGHLVAHVRLRDGHGRGVLHSPAALSFEPEPDRVFAGVFKHGQRSGISVVCGGGVSCADPLREDVQRDRVFIGVVHAGITADRVLDCLRGDRHACRTGNGFAVRLLDPVPNGVLSGKGERGVLCGICIVCGGGVGHGCTLGGDIHCDCVRIAVVFARETTDGVLDFRLNDAVGMRDLRGAVRALAGDFHGVAARRAGGCVELRTVLIVGERPFINARAAGRKVHGAAGVGIAGLSVEGNLIAHICLYDGHGFATAYVPVVILLDDEPDGIFARIGECGIRCVVFAVQGGGVGHARALGDHIDRDGVRCAVVHAAVAAGTVIDLRREDAVRVRNIRGVVCALAGDFHGIAAHCAGGSVELRAVFVVGERPFINARTAGAKSTGLPV